MAAAHSDLDVDLVTETIVDARQEETAGQATTDVLLASPLVVDLTRVLVSDLPGGTHFRLGRASLLVFGAAPYGTRVAHYTCR